MDPLLGLLLVLCVLALVYFGPGWGVRLAGKARRFKRRVHLSGDARNASMVGRRKSNR